MKYALVRVAYGHVRNHFRHTIFSEVSHRAALRSHKLIPIVSRVAGPFWTGLGGLPERLKPTMKIEQPAIKLTRAGDGWTWAVIDARGEPQASGSARVQQDAMEAAWQAVRTTTARAPRAYPEIIVDLACVGG